MKQLLQNLSNGTTEIVESPAPAATKDSVISISRLSLISAGTERMLVDFGKSNYLDKARQQPEKVKMVLEKIQSEGLVSTIEAVRAKLAEPIQLGYSNVGVVSEVGGNVEGISIGDRVVSNGSHADTVRVPMNLCAVIPDNVDNESAAFTVLGSIALQGIRLAAPTLGESIVVSGVGVIGLLAVQLLRAQGCRVLAIDFDDAKLALAAQFGAETCNLSKNEDPVTAGIHFSRGTGVDAVIIAATTKSSEPVKQAARMCRKRGRIVLVGVTGLELDRSDFYEKELTFQVSCSYGPGRYDANYEEKGQDYPVGFVRWTEQRNFETILDLLSAGALNVQPLISQRFAFNDAALAYEELSANKATLGIFLEYDSDAAEKSSSTIELKLPKVSNPSKAVLGFIGAGNYASRTLIPAFKETKARVHTLATTGGVSSVIQGQKAGFEQASSDSGQLFKNNEISTIVIATRHNSHAGLVAEGLEAGKHIFVEKPLCLTLPELRQIESVYANAKQLLMVGFNRRFAPQIETIKTLLDSSIEPKVFVMTVNAGEIPSDHWTQDRLQGGGRIIGEACHFIDLLRYLSGAPIDKSSISRMVSENGDTASLSLQFADGSAGFVHYLANGNKAFPKERLEVFCGGRILQLDNFRKLKGFGWPGFKKQNLFKQDKGQVACVKAFVEAIETGGESPIPFDEIVEVSRVCIELANQ